MAHNLPMLNETLIEKIVFRHACQNRLLFVLFVCICWYVDYRFW